MAAERAAQNLFASMETKTGALFVPFSHVLALVYSFCAFFASPNVEIPHATPIVDQVPVDELRMVMHAA